MKGGAPNLNTINDLENKEIKIETLTPVIVEIMFTSLKALHDFRCYGAWLQGVSWVTRSAQLGVTICGVSPAR